MNTLFLSLFLFTNMTYTFPASPFYYDYDLYCVQGVVSFVQPDNQLLFYHFEGYGQNTLDLYGSGIVEVYHRGTLFDTIYVPEPSTLYLLPSLFLIRRKT